MDWQYYQELVNSPIVGGVSNWTGIIGNIANCALFFVQRNHMNNRQPKGKFFFIFLALFFTGLLILGHISSHSIYQKERQRADKLQKQLNEAQIQWYLKINKVVLVPFLPNTPHNPIRIFPNISGKTYSYPLEGNNEEGWIEGTADDGYSMPESFPIPCDLKPPYRIKFKGKMRRMIDGSSRNWDEMIEFPEREEFKYDVCDLPIKDCNYIIIAKDPQQHIPQKTTITIYYDIAKGN